MATTPQVTATVAAPAPRSPKLLIALLIAVSLVAVAAVGYVFAAPHLGGASEATAKAPVPEKPIFVTLEPITVNLQAEGRARLLHVGMALKVRDEAAKAQIVEFMPELRSRLLLLLSNRQPDTLVTSDDKARLAEEILAALNAPLAADKAPQGIASVSFNTFVVQ